MTTPADAGYWAGKPRSRDVFIVNRVDDGGEHVTLEATGGTGFIRSKRDLGRDIQVGEHLVLETVNCSLITGLRDEAGVWLFHLTDEDLAEHHREQTENSRRRAVEDLERNRKVWAEQEAQLPEWLRQRITRFREAGGEEFLLKGWGYELVICRLADLMDRGQHDAADALAGEEGVTGNQWSCAKALATVHADHGDAGVILPAGLAPLTGSADYS